MVFVNLLASDAREEPQRGTMRRAVLGRKSGVGLKHAARCAEVAHVQLKTLGRACHTSQDSTLVTWGPAEVSHCKTLKRALFRHFTSSNTATALGSRVKACGMCCTVHETISLLCNIPTPSHLLYSILTTTAVACCQQ